MLWSGGGDDGGGGVGYRGEREPGTEYHTC